MYDACKGCGAPILWGKDGEKMIPLDPRPPIYYVDGKECRRAPSSTKRASDGGYFAVSHFATCPQASRFSKKGKTS